MIGTEIDWPATRCAGRAGDGVPTEYWLEFELRPVRVSASVAVRVAVFVALWPIVVAPNLTAEPVRTGVTGEPKAST